MKRSTAAIGWVLVLAAGAAPAAAPTSAQPGPSREAPADAYARLLATYLHVVSKPGEPLITRFDYARLRGAAERGSLFERVKKQLLGLSPAKMTPRERLAWAINSYNFLVLRAVTEHLEGARKGESGASVLNITIDGQPFFDAPLVTIEGTTYSLNTFERHFVFLDFDREAGATPPAALDARAHFALVCAAKGCPPLLPHPYRADSLDAQLDFVTHTSLASGVHLKCNPDYPPWLEASSIFDWYAGDFGGPDGALAFLLRHAPEGARIQVTLHRITRITDFIEWDWSLNQLGER